ncbi:MAG: hypothetical protein AAF433_10165 [Bacteroidota bacterium]
MKNYSHYLLAFVGLYLFLFSTGCPEDGTGTGTSLPPEILLTYNGATDLPFGQPFTVSLRLDDGDAALQSLAITKDGINVPFSELTFDGGAVTANNPLLISGADVNGVTYEVTIDPATPAVGSNTYFFAVTDADGLFDSEGLTINYEANPATASLSDVSGFISGDATLTTLNTSFDVRLSLARGDNPMTSLTIYEDGVALPADNLIFNEEQFTAMNPLTFLASEQDAVTYDINITPTSTAVGTRTYRFDVLDNSNQIGSLTLNITFEESDLQMTLTGVLLNQGGDVGTGGLDLDTGAGVGSNNADAEIQDEGIDLDLVATQNWRQQISAVNDAVLRVVDLTALPDGFSFATVTSQDQIIQAYNTGTVPDGDDANCNCSDSSNNEEVTQRLEGGELLTVLRDGRYYLIEVVSANIVLDDPSTPLPQNESNEDFYELNIKY